MTSANASDLKVFLAHPTMVFLPVDLEHFTEACSACKSAFLTCVGNSGKIAVTFLESDIV